MKLPAYRNPDVPVEDRINDLLARMTPAEKTAQINQGPIGRDTNPDNLGAEHPFNPLIGSILSFGGTVSERNRWQKMAVEQTRLGIPIIWGYDVIHGWKTTFPIPLAQACSFHPALTEKSCAIAAEEAYYEGGVNWTFSPMVEVSHEPRWGRSAEGYGEDPYVAGQFAAAAVRGYQGNNPARPGKVAACLKHFVGYSASEAGSDYSYTDISSRALWEWYLPPFEAGVKAGALTLMSSFNDIGGIPAVANRYTMTDILRRRWGFTGFVVSDWAAVSQMADQGYTRNQEKMTIDALSAGNDMDMADGVFFNAEKLVEDGKLPVATLDEAVRRILRVKFQIGLFEHPYIEETETTPVFPRTEDLDFAVECARESMVLLKNERQTLPLIPAQVKRIAVIGPMAEDPQTHCGCWPGRAFTEDGTTMVESINHRLGSCFPDAVIEYTRGCDYEGNDRSGFDAAVANAKAADVTIIALGEMRAMTGEDCSCAEIRLPGLQEELALAAAAVSRKSVLLVASGRPIVSYAKIAEKMDAILHLWQGGYGAARACVEILAGKCNPSGKLAMTFPRSVGQIPCYNGMHQKARPPKGLYFDLSSNEPMYPFGFGLSYTKFEYGELKQTGPLHFEFELKNVGSIAGKEAVIWQLGDPEANLTQPIRRVISFEKVFLVPGEGRTIAIDLAPMEDLAYVNPEGRKILEDGWFILEASRQTGIEFSFVR